MKKLSIRDIGRELGVSITTVSFILNGKAKEKRISEALTKKVLDFVEKVNYTPNVMAQALRTGKSKLICLMVEDISNNFFFSQVARLIEEKAHSNGYRVIFCSTDNDKTKTKELIKLFRDRLIDGYIITPPEGIEKEIVRLLDDNIPVILADRNLPGLRCSSVMVDNYESSFNATQHLINQGFENISYFSIESNQPQMADRLRGYESAMANANRQPLVKNLDYYAPAEKNIEQISDYIQQNPQIDAIFFATNYICNWGLEVLRKLKYKIPDRVGLVSYDDTNLFKLYNPSITAVAQPIEQISENILRLMLDTLHGKYEAKEVHEVVVPARLLVRESSIRQVVPA
ncbi:LacI family transcriptional regulator [Dyadobacter jejuensis]|uniref:LacI family transcriptional regulator n=1 Tax=Dyadobacter jejuensis TaxID=1082580 RepID=A0A316AP52_9BACT|nr:LacI family DNA-binding transcriptional regulator [Dyadobacter jejuensis]PWJ59565.1 LacI family transcriptional regulator [Dyadobacter jejuensis]